MKNKCLILLVLLLGSWLPALAQTEQKTAYCGQIVTLTPTPATGYHFVRWSDGNTDNPRQIEISSETTVFDFEAVFEANSYTLTVEVKTAGTGSVERSSIGGTFGEQVTVKAIESDPCYQFDHWEDAAGNKLSESISYSYTLNDDVTIYAHFVEREFIIRATATHGTVSISVQ